MNNSVLVSSPCSIINVLLVKPDTFFSHQLVLSMIIYLKFVFQEAL